MLPGKHAATRPAERTAPHHIVVNDNQIERERVRGRRRRHANPVGHHTTGNLRKVGSRIPGQNSVAAAGTKACASGKTLFGVRAAASASCRSHPSEIEGGLGPPLPGRIILADQGEQTPVAKNGGEA